MLTVEVDGGIGYALINVVRIHQNFGECTKSRTGVCFTLYDVSRVLHVNRLILLDISENIQTDRIY